MRTDIMRAAAAAAAAAVSAAQEFVGRFTEEQRTVNKNAQEEAQKKVGGYILTCMPVATGGNLNF